MTKRNDVRDISKLRIKDGVIHYRLYRQDGGMQSMSCADTQSNRMAVSSVSNSRQAQSPQAVCQTDHSLGQSQALVGELMQKLLTALNAAMGEIGQVRKAKTNTFHNYKYAGEEEIIEEVRPMLLKHGLMLIPSLEGDVRMDDHGNSHLVMNYTLAHVSGEVLPNIRIPGCGNDRANNGKVGDKGTYKALTGANKYALMKLLMIATSDDPEKDSNDVGSVGERETAGFYIPTLGEPRSPKPDDGVVPGLAPITVAQLPDPVSQAGPSTPQDLFDVAAAFVAVCSSKLELERYWVSNTAAFEGTLKQTDRGLYNKLLDKFKARKLALAKEMQK